MNSISFFSKSSKFKSILFDALLISFCVGFVGGTGGGGWVGGGRGDAEFCCCNGWGDAGFCI